MNLKMHHIAAMLLMLALGGPATAQGDFDGDEVEMMTKRYTDAYDSLIGSYYLRQFSHSRLLSSRELSLEEFDALPDSVIANRLANLHTVIPMTFNSEVRSYIRFYLKYMSRRLDVMLSLSQYYHPLFEDALSRYGVPEELKYLTIVESAMNPMATSRAGAAGLWQFMYSTGKNYGLEVNSLVDERRDPVKASYAAAHYLHDLYAIFGDWTLVIASYNCGPNNVNKAIKRAGGSKDYWTIYPYLPAETRGYVPAFIAANYIMNYYCDHNICPVNTKLPQGTDTLQISRNIYMERIAELTGISRDELRALNPQYRTSLIPGESHICTLRLPTAAVNTFIEAGDSIYAPVPEIQTVPDVPMTAPARRRDRGRSRSGGGGGGTTVTVRKGDTLSDIASRNHTTVAKIKSLNGIKGTYIYTGQKIRVN